MITRRSTNVLAIADRDVAEAVRYVRQHACDADLEFEDILAHLESLAGDARPLVP